VPPAPPGPAEGPAGGDLTGTYPNPLIAAAAVGGLELGADAVAHDTSVINTALGNFTSKIGTGAVGRTEIADGEVRATELGAIHEVMDTAAVASDAFQELAASCPAGEQLISGGADWSVAGGTSASKFISESTTGASTPSSPTCAPDALPARSCWRLGADPPPARRRPCN